MYKEDTLWKFWKSRLNPFIKVRSKRMVGGVSGYLEENVKFVGAGRQNRYYL